MHDKRVLVGDVFKDEDKRGVKYPFFTVIKFIGSKAYGKRTLLPDGVEGDCKIRTRIHLDRLTSGRYGRMTLRPVGMPIAPVDVEKLATIGAGPDEGSISPEGRQ